MNVPKSLEILSFEQGKEKLTKNKNLKQTQYLLNYLHGLNAKKILIEPNYFDRDYLSEFASFYSTSVYGYENICQRFHFFSDDNIDRALFEKAVGEDQKSIQVLKNSYLGFCVLRPIQTQFGRTVLKWYENKDKDSNRLTVKREYVCHVAGLELKIEGLAWQQQDTGVGACATIALWSALQSSAFDDFHAIPTTAEITKLANKTASLGSKTFPSRGLTDFQLYEAIKELGLSPMVQNGDVILSSGQKCFTKDRFMSSIASYIRSGYPVIILGDLKIGNQVGLHAVCTVGFRDKLNLSQTSTITLEDSSSDILYIHDDNIGPNARFKIKPEKENQLSYSVLHLEAPKYSPFQETDNYQIIPKALVVATHNEIRTSPNHLHFIGLNKVLNLYNLLQYIFKNKDIPIQLSLGTRFIKLTDYVHTELNRLLGSNSEHLSQIRLDLWEKVRPMSLHLGLVRIGLATSSVPLVDVLYDTTDSNIQAFYYITFKKEFHDIIKDLKLI